MNKIQNLTSDTESLIVFGVIVLITIIAATIVGNYFQKKLIAKATEQKSDITNFLFIKHLVIATIYLFGLGWALLSLPISETFAHSLFASAGASTLIVGFASQEILGNAMSGILLVFKKPFKINDIIEVQGNKGKVIELNLHDTVIEDENKNRILIPNTMITNGIIKNYHQG